MKDPSMGGGNLADKILELIKEFYQNYFIFRVLWIDKKSPPVFLLAGPTDIYYRQPISELAVWADRE
jgi:hypothetical protein